MVATCSKDQICEAVAIEVRRGYAIVRKVDVRLRGAQTEASGAIDMCVDVRNRGRVRAASVQHIYAASSAERLVASAGSHDVADAVAVDVSCGQAASKPGVVRITEREAIAGAIKVGPIH